MSKSLPFKLALTNAGPSAGTKNTAARNAKMENPMDEYNAGKDGTGSMNGRKINHAATGTRLNRSTGGRGRGGSAIAVVSVDALTQSSASRPAPPHLFHVYPGS